VTDRTPAGGVLLAALDAQRGCYREYAIAGRGVAPDMRDLIKPDPEPTAPPPPLSNDGIKHWWDYYMTRQP